jgi:hypothetical protein
MKAQGYFDTQYSRSIILTALLTAVIFFVGSRVCVQWRGEAEYIVYPKSEIAALQLGFITKNLSQMTSTEKFYLEAADLLEDSFSRNDWERSFDSQSIEGSSIIRMSYVNKDIQEVKRVLQKSKKAFYILASASYDVRKDITIRTFDSFTVRKEIHSPFILFVYSLIGGIVMAWLIEFIVRRGSLEIMRLHFPKRASALHKTITKKNWWEDYHTKEKEAKEKEAVSLKKNEEDSIAQNIPSPLISSEGMGSDAHVDSKENYKKSKQERFVETDKKEVKQESGQKKSVHTMEKKEEAFIAAPSSLSRKSSAPINLPISPIKEEQLEEQSSKENGLAPSNLPVTQGDDEGHGKEEIPGVVPGNLPTSDAAPSYSQLGESKNTKDEPTEEELKERLNKLLRGEM